MIAIPSFTGRNRTCHLFWIFWDCSNNHLSDKSSGWRLQKETPSGNDIHHWQPWIPPTKKNSLAGVCAPKEKSTGPNNCWAWLDLLGKGGGRILLKCKMSQMWSRLMSIFSKTQQRADSTTPVFLASTLYQFSNYAILYFDACSLPQLVSPVADQLYF